MLSNLAFQEDFGRLVRHEKDHQRAIVIESVPHQKIKNVQFFYDFVCKLQEF